MVCWPSLLMTGLMWRAQVDHFASSHKMVLIDSPGHGESDPLNRYFTLEECALCLSQILDQLEIEDCVLLGNSWGGMMGGVFVALYPSRTRAAVLMNCTASVAGWRQKIEFLLMTSILRRPKERSRKWWNTSAQRWPQPERTPSAGRSIASFRAAPSIVPFWVPFENRFWWWLVRRTEHFRSPKPAPWRRPSRAVCSKCYPGSGILLPWRLRNRSTLPSMSF